MTQLTGHIPSPARHTFRTGAAVIATAAMMGGCSFKERDEAATQQTHSAEEVYHANNDIAMTLRSLADALRVGEPLDSAEYNYEGVLTDGQGAPLYTDMTGSPGAWEVEVTDDRRARIRNLYLGDLLPDDLRTYVMESLDLSEADILTDYDLDEENAWRMTVYDLGGGTLRFETRSGEAANGLEGPLVNIIIESD
ncbi:MAG: hypothetical protein K2O24_00945 [Muribaculaceae bacterium]|nr:hypothetical protein [Muribaculaceae bacterium]